MTALLAPPVERFAEVLASSRRRLDKETVHQLRVSIRRLQAALRLMGQTENRRALRPLMQAAGAVRNCDISLELVRAAALPPGHGAYAALRATRRAKASVLKKALLVFVAPTLLESAMVPPRNALKDFFRAGRRAIGHEDEERLHALRLAGKRLRYTIELLTPLLDASTPGRLRELKQVQEVLGAINDCATARLLVNDAAFHEWLAAEQTRRIEQFEECWRVRFGVLGAWESWWLFLGPALDRSSPSPAPHKLSRTSRFTSRRTPFPSSPPAEHGG